MNDHAGYRVLRNAAVTMLVALGAATSACSKTDDAVPPSASMPTVPKTGVVSPATTPPANAAPVERPPAPVAPVPAATPDRPAAPPVIASKPAKPAAVPAVPPRVEVVSVVLSRAPQFTRDDLIALSKASDKVAADEGPIRFALERWMEFQAVRLRQNDFIDETAEELRTDDQAVPTETLRFAGPDSEKPIDEEALQKDVTLLKDKRPLLVAVFGADRNLDFDRTRDVFVVKLRVANAGTRGVTYLSGRFDVADAAGKVCLHADFENATTIAAGGSIDIDGTLPFRVNAAHLVTLEKSLATAKWTFKSDKVVYGK